MFSLMEGWAARVGSALVSFMFLWAVISQYFDHLHLTDHFTKYTAKLARLLYLFIQIRFPEQTGQNLNGRKVYWHIESYLASKSTAAAMKPKAEMGTDSKSLNFSLDDYEEIVNEFKGVKVWWSSHCFSPKTMSISLHSRSTEKRFIRTYGHLDLSQEC